MSGASPALIIDTRPVWESDSTGCAEHPNVSYLAAPLQRLRRLPQDPLLKQWSDLKSFEIKSSEREGKSLVALVATSPASVEALQGMPAFCEELVKGFSQKPALFAVGPGSASSLAAWASLYGLDPLVTAPPQGSGVEAFLQLFHADTNRATHEANTLYVLLESTTNQPDLAQGLCNNGLRVARLGVYERIDHPLQLVPTPLATCLVFVVVTSSALVARAVEGLASQGLAPQKAHWFCHHIKIMESLKRANLPLVHQLTDLAPSRIIAKVIELSRMND